MGIFDRLAECLIRKVSGRMAIAMVLVMLCFFSSMLITNDVALITFVPFAIILLRKQKEMFDEKWVLRIVVMQTVAANLGSMLTPVGNPQNLYLFGLTQMGIGDFILLMLPYSVAALLMLAGWIVLVCFCSRKGACQEGVSSKIQKKEGSIGESTAVCRWKMWGYLGLFAVSLLVVGRILPWYVLTVLVFGYAVFFDRKTLKTVDYSLLATFFALFLFIGNLGRMEMFRNFLEQMIQGRERITAVVASQVMSNVPAAILLSGFTDSVSELIVGTNLGGLGTLIASMASLISFKYIAREYPGQRGRYLGLFTIVNVIFLLVLLFM